MRYPKFLEKGGTIGFVAPSYGCNIEPYRTAFGNAQKKFHELGYKTELGPNCYEGCGVGISSTPQNCAAELMEYYCNATSDVLISCGGGELMCEDLSYMDFEQIKAAAPKWYMGYSDNTNMSFLLTTLCDVASIYAPCAAAFGMEPWHPAIGDAFDVLTGKNLTVRGYDKFEREGLKDAEHPLEAYNVTEPCERKYWLPGDPMTGGFDTVDAEESDGVALSMVAGDKKDTMAVSAEKNAAPITMEGRLIGGCLDVLTLVLGTRFDCVTEFVERYKDDGFIWFVEACDLNTMGIRRALWQMEEAGWLKYVKGFLVGRPLCHGEAFLGLNQYDAVTGILGKYNVPILMDLDFGHIPPAMPLICGSYAKVQARGNDIEIQMELR